MAGVAWLADGNLAASDTLIVDKGFAPAPPLDRRMRSASENGLLPAQFPDVAGQFTHIHNEFVFGHIDLEKRRAYVLGGQTARVEVINREGRRDRPLGCRCKTLGPEAEEAVAI